MVLIGLLEETFLVLFAEDLFLLLALSFYPLPGKPLSFDWNAISSTPSRGEGDDENEDENDEDLADDPMGLAKMLASWKPARLGGTKPGLTVSPDSVVVNDFVIVRATSNEDDASSFQFQGIDVPVWLCKVHLTLLATLKTRHLVAS